MRKLQWINNGRSSRQFQHGRWTKLRARRRLILEARKDKRKVHFASLMASRHLKNAALFQQYKGRVVLRRDFVKDDSGACAVFTEQGSSASQMTAAKVMEVIARLPDCDGQAADAASACTQVKLDDALGLLKILKSECPDVWKRLPRHKWPTSWEKIEHPVVTSRTKFVRSSITWIAIGKAIGASIYQHLDVEKYRIANVFLFIENKGYFCHYMWTIFKWLERSRICLPCGRI